MVTSKRKFFLYSLFTSVIFVFFFAGVHALSVWAADPPPPDTTCPEEQNLKNRSSLIGGNAWNPVVNWVYNQSRVAGKGSFGVKKKPFIKDVQTGGEIYGWSWAPKYGYVCWGKTCGAGGGFEQEANNSDFCLNKSEPGCLTPPTGGSPEVSLDFDHAQKICGVQSDGITPKECAPDKKPTYCRYPLKGWIKVRGLKDDGWVSMSGPITSTTVPYPPTPFVEPNATWSNWPTLDCTVASNKTDPRCTYQVMYDPSKGEFVGWAWSTKVRWFSFSGSTHYETGSQWKNKYICGSSCADVSYNTVTKKSRWNTSYIGVWVRALQGNIYSLKGFGDVNPPPSQYNTDYLIVTGQYKDAANKTQYGAIAAWEGRCDDRGSGAGMCIEVGRKKDDSPDRPSTPSKRREGTLTDRLPISSQKVTQAKVKRNALGTLNIEALLPKRSNQPVGSEEKNGSGVMVRKIAGEQDIWGTGNNQHVTSLGGRVYYYEGDLIIGTDDDRWKPILPNETNASFTILVKGNIVIKRPISYETINSVKNFKELSSFAWVALKHDTKRTDAGAMPRSFANEEKWKEGGNIIIDDCMPTSITPDLNMINGSQQYASIAGTLFAENSVATGVGRGGEGTDECKNLFISYDADTGEKDADGNKIIEKRKVYYDVPLQVDGVIVSKELLFRRVYRGLNRASETIANTGRLFVNPPPGFAEFAKGLPLW